MARLGCKAPFTLRISGTRRTTLSASGRQLRKPTPAACCASSGTGDRSPGKGVRNFAASSPAVTNPALGEALGAIGQLGDEAAEDDGRRRPSTAQRRVGSVVGRGRGVAAVLFREQEIEGDRRDPGAFQRVDKRGEALARPRPLPEPLEQFVVDRDNADGLVECVRARLPALVLVEDQILHHRPRGRADNSSEQRQRASGRRGQCVKSGLVRPSHFVLAARGAVKIEERPLLSSG